MGDVNQDTNSQKDNNQEDKRLEGDKPMKGDGSLSAKKAAGVKLQKIKSN